VTSNSPEMSFIYSRWARRDKQTAEKAVYLFTVSSPRQANRRKSRLSVRGEFAVTSNSPKIPFICSRCARRDKQTAEKVVYLFAEISSCQTSFSDNCFVVQMSFIESNKTSIRK